jgi:hypothetical protein
MSHHDSGPDFGFPHGDGEGGQAIVEGAPVSMGREARVTDAGDYRFFAGWRSDPFFFDTQGALNNLWIQADRGARPQQAVFLTGAESADYLAGEPADDARFVAKVTGDKVGPHTDLLGEFPYLGPPHQADR